LLIPSTLHFNQIQFLLSYLYSFLTFYSHSRPVNAVVKPFVPLWRRQ